MRWFWLDGGGEGYGEEVVGVLPRVGGGEVGGGEEGRGGGGGEFVAVFGVDGFAGGEGDVEGWAGGVSRNVNALGD